MKNLKHKNKLNLAQKQAQPSTKLVTDLLSQFSGKQDITIDEEMIAKLFRGLF